MRRCGDEEIAAWCEDALHYVGIRAIARHPAPFDVIPPKRAALTFQSQKRTLTRTERKHT